MPKPIYTEVAFPEIVRRANALAARLGFPLMPEGRPAGHQGPPSACIPQVGRLLQALAAGKPGGRIAEQGTGAGVGAAWLASGLVGGATLLSAEIDPRYAAAAAELFRDDPRVTIHAGDWRAVMSADQPFDLLFMDATTRADLAGGQWDALTELVTVGGQIVMDDLTPVAQWPPEWEGQTDHKREFAFANQRVAGAEVLTTPTTAALIVTRIR